MTELCSLVEHHYLSQLMLQMDHLIFLLTELFPRDKQKSSNNVGNNNDIPKSDRNIVKKTNKPTTTTKKTTFKLKLTYLVTKTSHIR